MMEKRRFLIKWFFYIALLWIFAVLQFMVFSRLRIGGTAPNLLPLLVVAVAVFEGPRGGGVYGFAAGLLLDAFQYPAEGFFTLFLMLGALAASVLTRRLFRRSLPIALLLSFLMLVYINLLYFLVFALVTGRAGPMALLTVCLPEILVSMPASAVFYLLVRGVHQRWGKTGDE